MLARTNLVILLLVVVAMISLFVGARFGLILALGLALGMTLEGLRFGFAGPWRAIILRREPAGFIAQLAAEVQSDSRTAIRTRARRCRKSSSRAWPGPHLQGPFHIT